MAVQKATKTVRSASKTKAAPAKTNRKAPHRQVEEEEAPVRRTKKTAAAPAKPTRAERIAAREAAKKAAEKEERMAAKKAAAAKKAKAKQAPEPEVESSQQILLTYVAELTGKKVVMTDTTYVVDGVEILRAQVVAMIGKTFFYRKTICLGAVADSTLVKGLTCVNTQEGDKVVLFDPSVVQFLTSEASAEEEGEDDEDADAEEEEGDDEDTEEGDDEDDEGDGEEDGDEDDEDDDAEEGDDEDDDGDEEGDDGEGDEDDFEF